MKVGGEDKRKNIFEAGKKTARNLYEIWQFGRLHTSRLR
jgi:hypothetical protein